MRLTKLCKHLLNPEPEVKGTVVKFWQAVGGAGFISMLAFASGIDYPPAPDGISWWNVFFTAVSAVAFCLGFGMDDKLTKRRFRIVKKIRHEEEEEGYKEEREQSRA